MFKGEERRLVFILRGGVDMHEVAQPRQALSAAWQAASHSPINSQDNAAQESTKLSRLNSVFVIASNSLGRSKCRDTLRALKVMLSAPGASDGPAMAD